MGSKKKFKVHNSITLPTLRGRIGDWFYYSTILSFSEVEKRIYLPEEIDEYSQESEKLGDWIQRELKTARTKRIVEYLNNQPQRFFNSLILGIYGGKPSFQELDITLPEESEIKISEEDLDYLGRTFGILRLNGDEKIFAVDGQHRAIGIREAVKNNTELKMDEVSVIFIGHSPSQEGKVRTRRLFSTLNRYAKPVNQSEIIALSEDDNCALVTRNIIDNDLLKDKILVNKNRSISSENQTAFTNILTLYDIVKRILTDEKVLGMTVKGKPTYMYTSSRLSDEEIEADTQIVIEKISQVIASIPTLETFFEGNPISRKEMSTNLIFRPIGQNVIFDILKVADKNGMNDVVFEYLEKDTFNLANTHWNTIFWDSETDTIVTEKSRQRYATLLLLEGLSIPYKKTQRDERIRSNFNITASDLVK